MGGQPFRVPGEPFTGQQVSVRQDPELATFFDNHDCVDPM